MDASNVFQLNVGGSIYATTLHTLTKDPQSLLAKYFGGGESCDVDVPENVFRKLDDAANSFFVDRDGQLFRYVLDYLRNSRLVLPDNFHEHGRLKDEAKFYRLSDMIKLIKIPPAYLQGIGGQSIQGYRQHHAGGGSSSASAAVNGTSSSGGITSLSGYITVGYRGTFAFGRDGQADVKFRKLTRVLVCGRAHLCKEVFGETLNESRDPDRGGENRYTARLFLKHCSLEWAFDMLGEHGFHLLASCASGTCSAGNEVARSGPDGEEQRWNHYNEFVFYRPNGQQTLFNISPSH